MTVLTLDSLFDADAATRGDVDRGGVVVADVTARSDSVEVRLFAKHDRIAGQPIATFRCPCGLVSELAQGATLEQLDEFDADNLEHIHTCRVNR
ncbi:hypothetical protein [Microbacterium rhizomatis]|uniref:Uncharacterized protein n=1 Tax=Microbacterium rhizomatis TaxID=1631477 RepID=A0A5J5J237_9MICO|nr:hypothetical protein [Microbacterium rhizomatis]KAA9110156.1 hypothetical protein F6B43_00130 [Microbacterium rhizomatis]